MSTTESNANPFKGSSIFGSTPSLNYEQADAVPDAICVKKKDMKVCQKRLKTFTN